MSTDPTIVEADPANPETATSHATLAVPLAAAWMRAGEVRASLVGRSFDSAADVAVVDGSRLLGLVTIERLLAASDDVPMAEILDDTPPIVTPGADQEVVAWTMVRQRETSAAVIDEEGRFLGLVPPIRMLAVLLMEHEEDLSRLSGVMHDADVVRTITEEPVSRRFWHRLPWLLVGLLGAVVTALVVSSFEATLSELVAVAFFVPGVVYLADAVGTQTEAVVIRGLSVGVSIRTVVGREALTGAAIGLAVAVVFAPVAWLVWGYGRLAIAVGLALFFACSIATVLAVLLPAVIDRLGGDPAFGSGPLATVIQDLLSILIYFAVVIAIV